MGGNPACKGNFLWVKNVDLTTEMHCTKDMHALSFEIIGATGVSQSINMHHLGSLEDGRGAKVGVVVGPVAEGAVRVVEVRRRRPDHAAARGQHSSAFCSRKGIT